MRLTIISSALVTLAVIFISGCDTAQQQTEEVSLEQASQSSVDAPADAASAEQSDPKPTNSKLTSSQLPEDNNVLFWPQEIRNQAFRQMSGASPMLTIAAGEQAQQLSVGEPLTLSWQFDGQQWDIDSYMQDQNAAGVVIIHDDQIRLQEYRLDFSAEGRWTSFSVAKSFTSTLVGAALQDGFIKSLDDPLTNYIPELAGSGYAEVSVRQLLTMTSGVRWNEDYFDKNSDVAQFINTPPEGDLDPTVVYMRSLPSEATPGTRWQYNTGETNLIGVLVRRATGKSIASYMSEKIWQPYGMTQDAAWMVNAGGKEISGCCISARVLDYALLGKFALDGGVIDGEQVVPEGWFELAGSKQADIGVVGRGYGFQWWTYDDGTYAAQGIFGQGIFIDPQRKLVIASNGNWLKATDDSMKERRDAFYRAVQAAVDNVAE